MKLLQSFRTREKKPVAWSGLTSSKKWDWIIWVWSGNFISDSVFFWKTSDFDPPSSGLITWLAASINGAEELNTASEQNGVEGWRHLCQLTPRILMFYEFSVNAVPVLIGYGRFFGLRAYICPSISQKPFPMNLVDSFSVAVVTWVVLYRNMIPRSVILHWWLFNRYHVTLFHG